MTRTSFIQFLSILCPAHTFNLSLSLTNSQSLSLSYLYTLLYKVRIAPGVFLSSFQTYYHFEPELHNTYHGLIDNQATLNCLPPPQKKKTINVVPGIQNLQARVQGSQEAPREEKPATKPRHNPKPNVQLQRQQNRSPDHQRNRNVLIQRKHRPQSPEDIPGCLPAPAAILARPGRYRDVRGRPATPTTPIRREEAREIRRPVALRRHNRLSFIAHGTHAPLDHVLPAPAHSAVAPDNLGPPRVRVGGYSVSAMAGCIWNIREDFLVEWKAGKGR